MKHRVWNAVAILGVLALAWLPSQAFGFAFTASNFHGYAAWDRNGDVVGTYQLDPRLSYPVTGKKFNVSAGMAFNFLYAPETAPVEGLIADPLQDWCWTLTVKDLTIPGYGALPNMSFSRKASYSDLLAGASWFQAKLDDLGIGGMFLFDYQFLTPNSGIAGFVFAGNVNPSLVPSWAPDQFFCPISSNATVTVTAAPCPTAPVPEPATIALFAVGVIGAGAMRRTLKK